MSNKIKRSILWIIILAAIVGALILFWPKKSIAPTKNNASASPIETSASITVVPEQSISNQISAAVLMYHHIGPLPEKADSIRKGLTISSEEFESQIKKISDDGFQIVSFETLDKELSTKKLPKKLVVLTFDDGYDDNFTYALPILKKYKATGTFFIISNKIGKDEYMNEDQIKQLISAGNEIGSHTVNHLSLDTLKGQALEREVKQSKEDLEKLIGKPIISFCYPAGKFNDETIAKVKEAGYKYAVTTQASSGIIDLNKLFEIPRYRISTGRNIEVLLK